MREATSDAGRAETFPLGPKSELRSRSPGFLRLSEVGLNQEKLKEAIDSAAWAVRGKVSLVSFWDVDPFLLQVFCFKSHQTVVRSRKGRQQ